MVKAIEPAVRLYEEPPTEGMEVETPWADIWLSADDWAEAFDAPDPGTPHNEARDQIWEELLTILVDKVDDEDVSSDLLRRSLAQNRELATAFNKAWPLLEAADLVGDLWSVPGVPAPVRALARPGGGPEAAARRRRRPGRCPTCRSWTPPGNGSAIPRHHGASVVTTRPSPPNVSGWTGSSTSSSRPTTTRA